MKYPSNGSLAERALRLLAELSTIRLTCARLADEKGHIDEDAWQYAELARVEATLDRFDRAGGFLRRWTTTDPGPRTVEG